MEKYIKLTQNQINKLSTQRLLNHHRAITFYGWGHSTTCENDPDYQYEKLIKSVLDRRENLGT